MININNYGIDKTQIGANEYKILVFKNNIFDFAFNVSLQPTGKDDVLPTYQLSKAQSIPNWTIQKLPSISNWLLNKSN